MAKKFKPLTEKQQKALIRVAGDLLDYCINNVAYFGESPDEKRMLDRAEKVLEEVRP